VSDDRVLVDGVALDRTVGTTDTHLRGVPVLTPLPRVMATRRGKTARRRANSRVNVRRVMAAGKPVTGERFLAHVQGCEPERV
jgi:hypothetical protein